MKLPINNILLVVLIIFTTTLQAQKQFEEFVLIGNSTGQKEIIASDVLKIFKGQQSSWSSGNSVIIVLPSSSSVASEKVAKLIFKANSSVMQKYWLGLVFQGRANPPFFFESNEEIIKFVKRTPGSIALLPINHKEILDSDLNIQIN